MPLLLNIEPLMCLSHTLIHYEISNPRDPVTNYGTPYVVTFYYKKSNTLSPNFNFMKIVNPYFQAIKTKDNNSK